MKVKGLCSAVNMYRDIDNPLHGDSVTKIELEDDGGGGFFLVSQEGDNSIRVDVDELAELYAIALGMLTKYEETTK